MRLMFPEKLRFVAVMAMTLVIVFFVGSADAQKRNAAPKKAVQSKKTEKQSRDARKDSRHEAKKDTKKDNRRDTRQEAKKDSRKDAKREKDRLADAKAKAKDAKTAKNSKESKNAKDPKNKAEARRAEAERRRKEEERRQAAIAEQRRREQAAREARERKLAFERGLRTETVGNIERDSTEGEDLNIRRAAVEALGGHAGSIVVMEAQTGKVLTIVNQDWAVRSSIRPCSTIKLVTAAAGLNEGVINKDDGSVRNASTRRNLDDAIAFSDNGYFQRVGANIGNTKLVEYGRQFGLGQQTGINLEGEVPGRLPYSNNNARIYSHGDDTEVSTIQLAVMVSAITNGGNRVLPRVPRNSVEQARFQTFYSGKVQYPQQNVRRMIPGMMGTAEYGTARRGVDAGLGIAGKTGSCIDKGSWVGLFASVAPIENPKYAVAVITRGQSERGKYAAAVAGKVYQALSRNIVRTDRNLAQTEFKLAPRNIGAIKPVTDAEEEDDADRADADTNAANTNDDSANDVTEKAVVPVQPVTPRIVTIEKPAQKKMVQTIVDSKPVFSKPVFAPVIITFPSDQTNKKRERVVRPN